MKLVDFNVSCSDVPKVRKMKAIHNTRDDNQFILQESVKITIAKRKYVAMLRSVL